MSAPRASLAALLVALAASCAPRAGHVAAPPAPAAAAPVAGAPGGAPGSPAPAGKAVALGAQGGATATAAPRPALEPEPPADPTPATQAWTDLHDGVDRTATVEDCLGCHGEGMTRQGHAHPVGVDYAEISARPGSSYRPLAEARARGVYLPAGRVVCLTCHSPSSPWDHFLAVPAALARVRVELADPSTFEPVEGPDGQAVEPPAPPAGSAVSPKPLCESCHAY